MTAPPHPKRPRPRSGPAISAREREVLDLLSQGLSNKEIGNRLEVSQFTVKNHLARIFGKLRVRSRTAAVMAYLSAMHKPAAHDVL
jgi:ATP/maltotriose-dependent transcriptional regulator MalT